MLLTEAQLQRDLQDAMRARDMVKVYVLRGLITAIKNAKVEAQVAELPEADIVALVRKELNKRVESIGYAEKAGRAETVAQNQSEKELLEKYLPPQLGPEELEETIRSLSAELQTTAIGPLMKALQERVAGRYDGKLASQLIRKLAS
jgi:uncharacterized protein YqeY